MVTGSVCCQSGFRQTCLGAVSRTWEKPDHRCVVSSHRSSDASGSGLPEVASGSGRRVGWEISGRGSRQAHRVRDRLAGLATDSVTLCKLLNFFVASLGPCLKMGTSTLSFIDLNWA